MTEDRWTAVDRYIADVVVASDPALDAALEASAGAGLPPINVAPNQGKLLALLVQIRAARTVLEIGTLGGYSTIWMARVLPAGGRLVTLEADPTHAEVARGNITRAGLDHIVDVRVGPALTTLPQLAAEGAGPFDLVFVDADKPPYLDYLEWSLRLSRPGTLIVADNVVQRGAVIEPEGGSVAVQAIRRFNQALAADPRLEALILPMPRQEIDGLALARVRDES